MFKNRADAGMRLGQALEHYQNHNITVLGIPRGGVEIGFEVAKYLNCEMSLVITRKLGYLKQPELAFGALAEDGTLYLNSWAQGRLTKEEIAKVMKREKAEIDRRVDKYRKGEPFPNLTGRTVLLVDDGIATGSTLFASLEMIRKLDPAKIVVAAPVCSKEMLSKVKKKADEVVVLEKPDELYSVSQVYEEFESVSDGRIESIMNNYSARNQLLHALSLI